MTNRTTAIVASLGVLLWPLAAEAGDLPEPERIYSVSKSQTKTYMHQFVESPDGTKYAFRYFPGDDQPTGRTDAASPCEIWVCNSDLTGHHKAFTSPRSEGGHGSDVIVWVTNDLIYYAGLSYQISTRKVLWRFDVAEGLPLARNYPVNANKLYVGVRRDQKTKGWYWLDPSSATKPSLHMVCDMKNLVPYFKGAWEHCEPTNIHQNPTDTKLHAVVFDRKKRQEYAFVLNARDGSVHSYLGGNGVGRCCNGHVLWYDDKTLLAGNQHPGLFDLNGKLIRRLASKGNHPSLSPGKKWWVVDVYRNPEVRLHRFGSTKYTVISGDVRYFGDYHPSFSRDGKYVFFAGKKPSEPHPGVYRVDVSSILD